MDIRTYLVQNLHAAVTAAFPSESASIESIILEKPKNATYGDFATTVALSLAKTMRKPPKEVAITIMQHFAWDETYVVVDKELLSTITGGFINFCMSTRYLDNVLREVVTNPSNFGRNQVTFPKKMLFEFVSANPTGPMVVVNGRAAAIGDVMARLNEWIGHEVHKEFYINDCGNQIELLGLSILSRYAESKGITIPIPEEGYAGEYIIDLAKSIAADFPEIENQPDNEKTLLFKTEALKRNIAQQKSILLEYGVVYDKWFPESELHKSGMVEAAREQLKTGGHIYSADGAVWFKSSAYGDEKDRVIVRTDGTPTYFLADLAYHLHKASRGYDESYTFWGPDHHGYLPRLEAAVKTLDASGTQFRNFIIQQVNLIRNGQPFKMSKRKGDFVTIADLLKEVGVDAARYFFLMRKISSHFDFDLDLATKKSDENPVFYVQYAHARTCSLLRHAANNGFTKEEIDGADFARLVEPEEMALVKLIHEFPAILMHCVIAVEPHKIPTFCETLSAQFHSFYQKHRILIEDRELSKSRLLLTKGVKNLLALSLSLLGVSSPESM